MGTTRHLVFASVVAVAGLLAINQATAQTSQEGRTSGPAAGSPTHMGSSGTNAPGTKHQEDVVREQSQAVKPTPESSGGTGMNQAPGGPATGRPGASGTESGPSDTQPGRTR